MFDLALHVNAQVRYRPLDGCEARIVGAADRAIITVNQNSQRRRKRFSIVHELGHWHHHRGRCLACRVEEYKPRAAVSPERTADGYAADLLMPNYLFRPKVREQKKLSFAAIKALADAFDSSQTATAIRLVESDDTPTIMPWAAGAEMVRPDIQRT